MINVQENNNVNIMSYLDCSLIYVLLLSTGTGMNDVSFAAAASRGSFANNPELSSSLGDSWAFFNYVGDAQGCTNFPSTVRNPNKAIVTIDAKTSEVCMMSLTGPMWTG